MGSKPYNGIGYRRETAHGHPKADADGAVYQHVLIAEKALGGYLPDKAQVHHVDYDHTNNSKDNLVICQDNAYHKLLHQRTDALRACGHADWRRCKFCKEYGPGDEVKVYKGQGSGMHLSCQREYKLKRKKRNRG